MQAAFSFPDCAYIHTFIRLPLGPSYKRRWTYKRNTKLLQVGSKTETTKRRSHRELPILVKDTIRHWKSWSRGYSAIAQLLSSLVNLPRILAKRILSKPLFVCWQQRANLKDPLPTKARCTNLYPSRNSLDIENTLTLPADLEALELRIPHRYGFRGFTTQPCSEGNTK